MTAQEFKTKATALIDDLKGVCATAGLGNDGNEFKIITQIFLYKFINDKFAYEVKRIEPALAKAKSWEEVLGKKSKDDYELILMQLGADTARLKPKHFLSTLWGKQNDDNFAATLDATLLDIAKLNADIAKVLNAADVKTTLALQGIEPAVSTPEALANTIREDHARWGKVIRDANIKAD